MTGLHLARLAVDARALTAYAIATGTNDDDRGYALHLAMRRRFGAAAPQPFRLLESGGALCVLGYVADPVALADAASLPPIDESTDRVFAAPPSCRAMPTEWRAGARFSFDVRVRPVVRFGTRVRAARANNHAAWQPQAGEIDAFVAACARTSGPVYRESVYRDWLATRMATAATVDDAALRQTRRIRTRRSTHGQGGRLVEGVEAVMTGTLTVTDPIAFAGVLARGVGRHAAFGFGMVLLAPPGRVMLA